MFQERKKKIIHKDKQEQIKPILTRIFENENSRWALLSTWLKWCWTEMQKAASMASVLVLIFPPAVLIF